MQKRGIRDGDILIANTALRPAHGKVAITILQGSFCLAMLEERRGAWLEETQGRAEDGVSAGGETEAGRQSKGCAGGAAARDRGRRFWAAGRVDRCSAACGRPDTSGAG